MRRKLAALTVLILLTTACAHKAATAPVPGSLNALDAWAYRIVADSTASIHSVKTWEQCSANNNPLTIKVDDSTETCDPKAGPFPMEYKGDLNSAINALNVAGSAGKAYHAGASNDATGLTTAVNQLSASVTALVTHIGGH